jgi:hypothetical protein
MNNMTKNFKNKSLLRHMADGGQAKLHNDDQFNGPMRAVDAMERGEDPNADRMKKGAEYGMKAPEKKTEPTFLDKAKAAADKLRATIGFAEGGEVDGAGGPTDDKIPAMLSDGEFVLPADTVQHVGVEQLEDLVAKTHKPVGGSKLRGMADGGLASRFITDTQIPPVRPSTMDPIEEQRRRVAARMANPSGAARGPTPLPQATEIPRAEFDAARAARGSAPFDPAVANNAAEQAAEARRIAAGAERTAAGEAMRAAPRAAPAAAQAAGSAARSTSALRSGASFLGRNVLAPLGRVAGTVAVPAVAAFQAAGDDYAAQHAAGGNQDGVAGAAGRVGSYLGSSLTLGALSPQEIGQRIAHPLDNAAYRAAADALPSEQRGFASQAMGTPGQPASARPAGGGNAPMIITGDNGARIPDSAMRLPAVGARAPGVTGQSVASGVDAQGNPIFDNASLLRMQARNGQPAVQEQGPSAPQEDPIQGALRNMLSQQGSGTSMINSRAGDINHQFDALQKQIIDTYDGRAQGTMISKLLDLQQARANALGQDQGALVNSQGNVVSADNSVRGQQSSALGDMASMRNNDRTNQTSLLREQLEGIRANDAAQRSGIKDNRDNFLADIKALAPVDKDNQPLAGFRPDEILARIAKTNPEVMDMDRASRAPLIASAIATMQNAEDFNNTRGIFGTEDSTATPTGVFKDETNALDIPSLAFGGIGGTSILRHMLPWQNNDRVIQMGTDAEGNPQLAYESEIGGDERYRQEVAKKSYSRNKDK